MASDGADVELKTKHRAMWASGDYPAMVETFLLPLGPRLVEAAGITAGQRVLDVAAGTGNTSIPAAQTGASVVASDLTTELLEAGQRRPEAQGLDNLEWVTADAENLPFDSDAFDVVVSSIGVMFAPHHQQAADELVRVCKPGGTIGLMCWTPEGILGESLPHDEAVRAAAPAGRTAPAFVGSEEHLTGLFGERVEFHTLTREDLVITAFPQARGYGEHFKAYYGPTIAARKNAVANGQEAEFDAALDVFCDTYSSGDDGAARFDQEYLIAVGTKA